MDLDIPSVSCTECGAGGPVIDEEFDGFDDDTEIEKESVRLWNERRISD